MIIHQLSSEDEQWAAERACTLQAEIEKSGRSSKYGAARRNQSHEDELNDHLTGQRGEIAAARVYGVRSNFIPNTFHSVADIGETGEVRTRREQWHDLYIREADPKDRYYILVIGSHQSGTPLRVIGGLWDKKGRNPYYLKNPGGYGSAWFIPQTDLEPAERYIR
jgi:hypothetical protein